MDLKDKDSKQSGSSKTNSTLKKFSRKDFPIPLFMETLRNSILAVYQESTSSQEDSPAKTSAMLERELASRGVVLHSGRITAKRLGYYDQESHSLRTYQRSLIEDLTLSLQTLPRSGMMRNGIVYRLPRLVRLTAGKESLLLPTLIASDAIVFKNSKGNEKYKQTGSGIWRRYHVKGYNSSLNLSRMAAMKMWPTPISSEKQQSNHGFPQLSKAVKMYPTCTVCDANHRGKNTNYAKLAEKSRLAGEVGGQLNPDWTEWLMGFPIGFTELSVSETQSFLNARKSLRKQSKKS